jgi:hypothetical protein
MRKIFLGMFAGSAVLIAIVFNVHFSNMNKDNFSKLSLKNVEALSGEGDFFSCATYCESNPWYNCSVYYSNGFVSTCSSHTLKAEYGR